MAEGLHRDPANQPVLSQRAERLHPPRALVVVVIVGVLSGVVLAVR